MDNDFSYNFLAICSSASQAMQQKDYEASDAEDIEVEIDF